MHEQDDDGNTAVLVNHVDERELQIPWNMNTVPLVWEEEIPEIMMWIVLSRLLSSLHPVHLLSSRHLRVQPSEARLLSSRLLYHFLCFNLFSPSIFHPLPAIRYLCISPLLSLFLLLILISVFPIYCCHHLLFSLSWQPSRPSFFPSLWSITKNRWD